MAFLPIFASIVMFISVVGVIIYLLTRNKALSEYDIVPNSPIIINIPKKRFSGGYSILTEKRIRENKNGTFLIEGFPFDHKQGEGIPRPPLQSFILLKNNLKPFITSERVIKIVTSSDETDYPEEMRDTKEGRFMRSEGLKADLINIFGEGITANKKVIPSLMKEWAGGEVSEHTLGKMLEENEKIKKILSLQKEDIPEENKNL